MHTHTCTHTHTQTHAHTNACTHTHTQDAMNVLGFTDEERVCIFKMVAGICHFGNIEVKQRPREEWASIPVTTEAEKVAHLLGLNPADLVKALLKPRIKVGNEYVQQGRTESQVTLATLAIITLTLILSPVLV